MNQKPSNDQLEALGLMLICKNENCNSLAIKEITGEGGASVDMCEGCGAVDYTTTISEEEYDKLQKEETV